MRGEGVHTTALNVDDGVACEVALNARLPLRCVGDDFASRDVHAVLSGGGR